jgi:exodeoxyribonuclease V beta subunit
MSPTPLNALNTPLTGRHLIEASAGTGKTFTLAALYLRLVLGHDPTNPERGPMLPPEILVMTFTRAATRELQDRIRSRLAGAARCFAGVEDPDPEDAILTGLLEAYPDDAERARHANHLRAAADWMDEAAIYTIDSFCRRMLRQYAFDSGHAFDIELSPDESTFTREAIEDYWREHIYPLNAQELSALDTALAAKKPLTVARLISDLRPLLGQSHRLEIPNESSTQMIRRHSEALAEAIEGLRRAIGEDGRGLETLDQALNEAWEQGIRKAQNSPNQNNWQPNFKTPLEHWHQQGDVGLPNVELERLGSDALKDSCKKNKQLPESLRDHPIVTAVDAIVIVRATLTELAPPFYAHAAGWVDQRIAQTRNLRGVFGFKDMLKHLRDALQRDETGARLANVIRQQFPVALVDEFQDTDPIQYAILQSVYIDPMPPGVKGGSPDIGATSLILIGDPKQAIFGFRGADLDTYIKAAEGVPEAQQHTLTRNYRSSTAMVEAVNALFEASPLKPRQFLQDGIDYHRVDANGSKARFEVSGEAVPALTLGHLGDTDDDDTPISLPLTVYRPRMAEVAATRIHDLLAQGHRGEAGFHDGKKFTPLAPADIAVLVRTGQEAALIRNELRQRGLASVYLSDQDNVLQTQEAEDILHWLHAMAEPASERRVRTALGTASLGWDWETLDSLFSNDARWEAALAQFQDYADRWQRRGILPALRQLIQDQTVAPRLLRQPGGERRLSNLLQISELLQEASATLDGPASLIRWLEHARANDTDSTPEDYVLRLESDSALIKVITLHKSKGLEYPLVFMPFVCNFRPEKVQTPRLPPEDAGDALPICLEANNEEKEAAEHGRLAEDMRLLYVGITRAVHACWLGTAAVREKNTPNTARQVQLHRSAFGRLLGSPADASPEDVATLLSGLADAHDAIHYEPVARPAPTANEAPVTAPSPAMARARAYEARPPNSERWWIASYSALVEDGPKAWTPGTAEEDVLTEEALDTKPALAPAVPGPSETPQDKAIITIPPGPATGSLLHRLLESLAAQQFPAARDPAFTQALDRSLRGGRWREWRESIGDWIGRVSEKPLPLSDSEPMRLTGLNPQDFIAELEFLIATREVKTREIDATIREHTLGGAGRPALDDNTLNGMVKGYIDLVFVHNDRYWVMDYKSNRLGDSATDYGPDALRQAVIAKRYDAQYALYLLALHRLLQARLGDDYDYDRHIGGAACWFLRGIDHPGAGLHTERPDRALVDALDALFNPYIEESHDR